MLCGIVRSDSLLLTPNSTRHIFLLDRSFASRQKNFENFPLLYMPTFSLFSSNLNHSKANQKNSIIKRWKYRWRELLKSYLLKSFKILTKKQWKKHAGCVLNFLQSPTQVRGSYLNPLFQSQYPIILLSSLSQEYLNS